MRLSLARHAPRLTALAPLAALALMTACSGMMQPVQDYDEYIAQQEASKGKWKEAEFTLPAKAPQDADLVSFPTLPSATLDYAIDTKSVQVTDDGVVRYVAVIRSKQGARNVSFEGIHCSSFESRLYATGRPDGTWVAARNSEWRPIRPYGATAYQGILFRDYLCRDKAPLGDAKEIVQNLRYPKFDQNQNYR
ncbi:lipoprotein [Pandoraea sp. NE5]|uniref:CNP1-like family protein n=1 Tax=unclassified Pandoraea TaxID=2624094 RepID=UPI0003484BFD|nr:MULTISPECIES: CNP1-like family protein [unclassified Pandoraea]BDD92562.1 lipoprotein [Pandoraea sp. NE5]